MTDKREDRDPPADDGISDDEFDRLIEQSSLGTPGARSLRKRVTPEQVDGVWARAQILEGSGDNPASAPGSEEPPVPDFAVIEQWLAEARQKNAEVAREVERTRLAREEQRRRLESAAAAIEDLNPDPDEVRTVVDLLYPKLVRYARRERLGPQAADGIALDVCYALLKRLPPYDGLPPYNRLGPRKFLAVVYGMALRDMQKRAGHKRRARPKRRAGSTKPPGN